MPSYPPIVYGLIQGSVFVYYVIMLVSAARKGLKWAVTLFYGSVFGLIIEILIVSSPYPGYHYATDRFLCIKGAPIWVAMGWGIVAYACTRTAQRLQFKQSVWSDLVWRPLAAGYLAVGIDITLDPVAQALGFWNWHCDCIILSPEPAKCPVPCPADASYPVHLLRYFDVPFDNFAGGWFGITATYSLSVFLVSMIHRWFTKTRQGAEPLHRTYQGDDDDVKGQPPGEVLAFTLIAPLIGLVLSVLFFWFVLRPAVCHYYALHPSDGQLRFCLAVFVFAGFATGYIALLTERGRAIDWSVMSVPIFFHGVPIVLLLFWAFRVQPALFLNAPANLVLSLLLFTWPFQSKLKARATALAATYRNEGIWAFLAALFDPRRLKST